MSSANAQAQARFRAANLERVREYDRKRMRAKIRAVRKYKAKKGCSCGVRDPDVLQLHHRDPSSKHPKMRLDTKYRKGQVQSFYNLGWRSLQAELPKCDVLCANCHAKHEALARRARHRPQ